MVKSHSCWDSVVVLAYFVVLQALKVLHHHGLHNLDVSDVADLEDNVSVDLIPGCYKAFNFSVLCTKSSHARQGNGVVVVVEAVEDPLVPALRLRDDPNLRAQVVHPLVNHKMPRCRQEALTWDGCVLHRGFCLTDCVIFVERDSKKLSLFHIQYLIQSNIQRATLYTQGFGTFFLGAKSVKRSNERPLFPS